jgi:UDP-2,3-diacylglucosamine pyrophosphatase LpxH
MLVAVISDLHLGSGDSADRFGHDDAFFERFLRRLESEFDRIVLLGDIWETLTSRHIYDPRDALKRAREAHPNLAQRFTGKRYHYVHGNHDWVSAEVDSAPTELILDDAGQRLLLTHGHPHDWLIRRARWLSECGVWLGGWAKRLGLNSIYRVGYGLDHFLSQPALDSSVDSFQQWALKLAQRRDADIVVTGHTHVPCRCEHAGRVYLNSGRCCDGELSYLALDTKNQRYSVVAS